MGFNGTAKENTQSREESKDLNMRMRGSRNFRQGGGGGGGRPDCQKTALTTFFCFVFF